MADLNQPKFPQHAAKRAFNRRDELFGWAGCLGIIALGLGAMFLGALFIVGLFKAADALLSWMF